MKRDAASTAAILAHLRARRENERRQGQLIRGDLLHKETIRAKLDGLCETRQFFNFERCGEERIFRSCECCGAVEEFTYRCNLKWCPICQYRRVLKRQQILTAWANRIKQPKHLVLTQKNFPVLTARRIREHTKNLAKFRRARACAQVRGGSVSVEITNEDRGWHLHSHWLLDVNWLDMSEVSQAWAALVGQQFAVCKVMDVREKNYVREVTKYVCEGSELAKWKAEHINEFVTAIKGRRFFFTFGSLRKLSADVKAELEFLKPEKQKCECGSEGFKFQTEVDIILEEARKLGSRKARPVASAPCARAKRGDDNPSNAVERDLFRQATSKRSFV